MKLLKRSEVTRITGLNLESLLALERKGLLRIVRLNQRDWRIPEQDLADLVHRTICHELREAAAVVENHTGIDRETADGLRKIYGYVPGGNRI